MPKTGRETWRENEKTGVEGRCSYSGGEDIA